MTIPKLTVIFDAPLKFSQVPKFRGGVIHLIQNELGDADVLFHNHIDEGFRRSYPLIQYKLIGGKAAIVCIGEGIDAFKEFLLSSKREIDINGEKIRLDSASMYMEDIDFQTTENFTFNLRHWLPFNTKNYQLFQTIGPLSDKIAFLEHILTGNILSMAKGLGYRFEQKVECRITDLKEPTLLTSKDVKMMSFDLSARTNIILPADLGLGKHVSIGYGRIIKIKTT